MRFGYSCTSISRIYGFKETPRMVTSGNMFHSSVDPFLSNPLLPALEHFWYHRLLIFRNSVLEIQCKFDFRHSLRVNNMAETQGLISHSAALTQ